MIQKGNYELSKRTTKWLGPQGWVLRKVICDRSKMRSWIARPFSQDSQAVSKNLSKIVTWRDPELWFGTFIICRADSVVWLSHTSSIWPLVRHAKSTYVRYNYQQLTTQEQLQEYDVERSVASHFWGLTWQSGSLTRLASDLGQARHKYHRTVHKYLCTVHI